LKLLIVGINYAPETSGNAPYTTGLAEHLAQRGHEVHVLTGQPHYPAWRRQPSNEIDGFVNGVHVHRRWHYIPQSHSALKRAIYETSFIGTSSMLWGLPRPDVTLGVIPSLGGGLIARMASARFKTPYGLLFQDLMGQAAGQSGVGGASKVEGIVRRSEGWIARGASRVAMVTEGFRPYLESIGVKADALHRVRNWTHVPPVTESAGATRARFGWSDDDIICLHAGNMGYKQGLDNVIDAAIIARVTEPAVRFVLMGDGNQSHALRARVEEEQLTNVQFLPPQDDSSYVNALAAADALLLSLTPKVTDMAFPSKVGSYVASGRPMIGSVSAQSEIGKELTDHGAALMIEPGNPEHLVDGIVRLASDELLTHRLVKAAQKYGRSFARDAALEELERFILRVAGQEIPEVEERELREVA
jgi:glycosyltransferase involved in cell wall biosynthesis